jgi:hypothetical protein
LIELDILFLNLLDFLILLSLFLSAEMYECFLLSILPGLDKLKFKYSYNYFYGYLDAGDISFFKKDGDDIYY